MIARALTVTALLMASLVPASASAQEPIDRAMVARIRGEGLERSAVPELFHTRTDVLGQRLTGSPAYQRAADWAQGRFAERGLVNARRAPFAFGRALGA